MMRDIFESIDELAGTGELQGEAAPSGSAAFPAMFLFVGEDAAKSAPGVKRYLKRSVVNGGNVPFVGIGTNSGDMDENINFPVPERRGESLSYAAEDPVRLEAFNTAARTAAERLMRASGFPQMNKCFIFTVTHSDNGLNALLPDFMLLFSEYCHVTVQSYLFVRLSGDEQGQLASAAFFRELDDCQRDDFIYSPKTLVKDGQRIPLSHEGAVFGSVFFLESYRSDMKYSANCEYGNAVIPPMLLTLVDRSEPVRLPKSVFLTAGTGAVRKPVKLILHIMYKVLFGVILGNVKSDSVPFPADSLLGYDRFASECVKLIQQLPSVDEIISVLPAVQGRDPDTVIDTNVRNILEYYGGADEEYFTGRYENTCGKVIDEGKVIRVADVIREGIDSGSLRPEDAVKLTEPNGVLRNSLNDLLFRLGCEEDAANAELDSIVSQPTHIKHGLFSKPCGTEILAEAIKIKYTKMLDILKLRLMRRLITNVLAQVRELSSVLSAAMNRVRMYTGLLGEQLVNEIYAEESTLTDVDAFIGRYTGIVLGALDDCGRTGSVNGIIRERGLYSILMRCSGEDHDAGLAELADTVLDIFRRVSIQPSVTEALALTFDEELYERFRNSGGGKDRGTVDTMVIDRLMEVSCANLRYSVFQPSSCLYCIGNGSIGFVNKLLRAEAASFDSVSLTDVQIPYYEQLSVYGIPTLDCVMYINECNKIYGEYTAANGESLYIDRKMTDKETGNE